MLVTCVKVVLAEVSTAVIVWLETGEGIVTEEEDVGNFISISAIFLTNFWIAVKFVVVPLQITMECHKISLRNNKRMNHATWLAFFMEAYPHDNVAIGHSVDRL